MNQIRARAHFLVLLTPSSLERCAEENDLFRREIESAILAKRNIVPLALDDFDFRAPEAARHLNGCLDDLSSYNALRIHNDYFFEGMHRLRRQYFAVPLDAVVHPATEAA